MSIQGLYLNALCSPENSLNDGSGFGRHLTNGGAGSSIVATPVVEGAYSILPSTGGGWLNSPAALNAIYSGTDWSYECYFYLTSMAAIQTVITCYTGPLKTWGAYLNTDGSVSLVINDVTTTSAAGQFTTSGWYYFGMSLGAAGNKIWISPLANISQTPLINLAGSANPTIAGAQIGRDSVTGTKLMSAGYQDSIIISNNTLTAVPTISTAVTPTATAVSAEEIRVDWEDVPNNDGYVVFRATSDSSAASVEVGAANQGVKTFRDRSCVASTQYWYFLRFIKNSVLGAFGGSATATTQAAIAAPTGLAAGSPTATTIPLTWTDPVTGKYIQIWRGLTDVFASMEKVGLVDIGDQTFTASCLSETTTYFFRLVAVSDDGTESSPTSAVSATTTASGTVYPGESPLSQMVWGRPLSVSEIGGLSDLRNMDLNLIYILKERILPQEGYVSRATETISPSTQTEDPITGLTVTPYISKNREWVYWNPDASNPSLSGLLTTPTISDSGSFAHTDYPNGVLYYSGVKSNDITVTYDYYAVKVQDGFPDWGEDETSLETIRLPLISVDFEARTNTPYQVGGGYQENRNFVIDILANSDPQRDDLMDMVETALRYTYTNTIDYSYGFPTNADGSLNTNFDRGPATRWGSIRFATTSSRVIRSPLAPDKFRHRAVISLRVEKV